MDADAVTFPTLIVAEDGWLDYLDSAARLSAWTPSAIKKYNRCRVLLYDRADRAWLVESIAPRDQGNIFSRMLCAASNRRIAVEIKVRPVAENPMGAFQQVFFVALDKDDDILTQHAEAAQLKAETQNVTSFDATVLALQSARVI